MKALITENLQQYLIKSTHPKLPFEWWDAEMMSKVYSERTGNPPEEVMPFFQSCKPNAEDRGFQSLCTSARLIFDNVDDFSPCHIINAGADGLFGLPSEKDLLNISVCLAKVHNEHPNTLLSEEDTTMLMGAPLSIDSANFLKNFVPNLSTESEKNPIILSRDSFYTN